MMAAMIRFAPNLITASAASNLPAPDRAIAAESNFQAGFVHMLREAFRNGTRGSFHESLLAVTDFGFRLQEIQTPILLWHGEADQNVPVAMARYVESAVPQCEAKFYPDEGHLSLFKRNFAEIIRALAN
jgi:pimeloyl-ACP methyl ester carboxylesterase